MNARRKTNRRVDPTRPDPDRPDLDGDETERVARADRLLDDVAASLADGRPDRRSLHAALDELVDIDGLDGAGVHRVERAVTDRLDAALAGLWERGWEPAEVVHITRRRTELRTTRLAVAGVTATLAEAAQSGVLPTRWRGQLEVLSGPDLPSPDSLGWVLQWRRTERLELGDAVEGAMRVVAIWRGLPDLEPLEVPPSRWRHVADRHRTTSGGRSTDPSSGTTEGAAHRSAAGSAAAPKLLGTIRALLAKAESTPFPAEADAFTAKAQDLMRRHAIDAALVDPAGPRTRSGDVAVRRVPVEEPYSDEKVELLAAVADLNDVQVVWDRELGLATIVGFPAELDVAELLFTSLLVQATRALNDPANAAPDRRAPAFRRAFLASYSERIARRLRQAQHAADRDAAAQHGAALVPMLAQRRDAVRAVTDELFGATAPIRTRMVDAAGWEAGALAAQRARLGDQAELPRHRRS